MTKKLAERGGFAHETPENRLHIKQHKTRKSFPSSSEQKR